MLQAKWIANLVKHCVHVDSHPDFIALFLSTCNMAVKFHKLLIINISQPEVKGTEGPPLQM